MVDPLARARRRAQRLLISGSLETLARLGRLHPLARREAAAVEHIRDVRYAPGTHKAHLLDVYRPRALPGPLPVLLYIHGGGFAILSKDTHWVMALAFARHGFLVCSINYRLAPRHPYPAGLEDVCAAAAFVHAHAARWGGDPTRLAVAGESAGANLTAALAVACSWRRSEPWARAVFDAGVRPRAVMPACGIHQVSDAGRFRRRYPHLSTFVEDRIFAVTKSYLPAALGANGQAPPGAWGLADPLIELERAATPPERPLPPFLVTCGTRDPLVWDSKRLAAAVERLGGHAELQLYPGEIHAFHALPTRPQARRCWGHHYAFLDRHLPG